MRKFILFIISIFCVAFAIIIFYNLYTSKNDTRVKVADKGSRETGSRTEAAIDIPKIIPRQDFIYPSDNIRDPFQTQRMAIPKQTLPTSATQNKPLLLKLTGVIWKEGKSVAIIRDSKNEIHLAKLGESIDSVKVIDIKPRMVKVQRDNEVISLALWPEAKM